MKKEEGEKIENEREKKKPYGQRGEKPDKARRKNCWQREEQKKPIDQERRLKKKPTDKERR